MYIYIYIYIIYIIYIYNIVRVATELELRRKLAADKKYVSLLDIHFLRHFAHHHPQMPDSTGI